MEVQRICQELAGAAAADAQRFKGLCREGPAAGGAAVESAEDPTAPAPWKFQSFTVESEVSSSCFVQHPHRQLVHHCRPWAPSCAYQSVTLPACLLLTQDDLLSMRSVLGDSVAYFERDRVASVDMVAESANLTAAVDATTNVPWGEKHICVGGALNSSSQGH